MISFAPRPDFNGTASILFTISTPVKYYIITPLECVRVSVKRNGRPARFSGGFRGGQAGGLVWSTEVLSPTVASTTLMQAMPLVRVSAARWPPVSHDVHDGNFSPPLLTSCWQRSLMLQEYFRVWIKMVVLRFCGHTISYSFFLFCSVSFGYHDFFMKHNFSKYFNLYRGFSFIQVLSTSNAFKTYIVSGFRFCGKIFGFKTISLYKSYII